ncbi:MAG: DoxX family protein [Sulfuricaulis sp.]|uniref:DoxX family protein n=1 Tax=Sulfuricaulis sp. TaxID=2003553 RepID=UPI0034A393BE
MINSLTSVARPLIRGLEFIAPLAELGIRLWAAKFFWDSALTKVSLGGGFPFIHMNPSTIMLFTYEYQVPILAPEVAAYLGTATEFVFPVLLAFGLGGRLAAAVLFVFNIVAVISYPGLEEAGIVQHQLYGTLLLLPLLRGPGKISIDHFIRRKWLV